MKRWIELQNDCLGPDKKETGWQMFLIIKRCCSYIAKKKSGPTKIVRRKDDVIVLTGKRKKDVLKKLNDFVERKNVILLPSKK